MAFQRFWATGIRWNRNAVSRGSPDIREALFPSSERNCSHPSLMGPKVSMAIGQKSWEGRRSSYFLIFNNAAASAAVPTTIDVLAKREFANVSEIVTSHGMHLPLPQGIKVISSGRLLSSCTSPGGSLLHGILALRSVRQIMSLMASWRAMLHHATSACWTMVTPLVDSSPTNACIGVTKTYPQSETYCHLNGLVIPNEGRKQWLAMQSPLCGARQASRRALLQSFVNPLFRIASPLLMENWSKQACLVMSSSKGRSLSSISCQTTATRSMEGSGMPATRGAILAWSSCVAAADARNT